MPEPASDDVRTPEQWAMAAAEARAAGGGSVFTCRGCGCQLTRVTHTSYENGLKKQRHICFNCGLPAGSWYVVPESWVKK